jgi:hypothetical protein
MAAQTKKVSPKLNKVAWSKTGNPSGLPWASGASAGAGEIATYRGRPLDVQTVFMARNTWANMVKSAGWIKKYAAAPGPVVIGIGMLPETHRGQHAQCAAGAFDSYITEIGNRLVSAGGGDSVLRLGWEANRMGSFPWAVTGDGSSYKACFRRWVQKLRAVPGQAFTIDWNMGAKGTFPYHVDQMYPGNDVVDIIGVQIYDRCPPVTNETEWNARFVSTVKGTGSPFGLGAWFAYAESKGKRLSLPEWGIGGLRSICTKPGFDNPFFIKKMYEFLQANASKIAYEAYFSGHDNSDGSNGSHKLAPSHWNPNAASMYRALWGG